MNVYDADHIRNVVLVGHQGSGKTSLAEAMLFVSGTIHRMGSVNEGSTVSDYHTSEKERQMSIFSSLMHAEWDKHKINLIDTPGYPDFVGEVAGAMKVADTAVFVMNATEGVEVGTELAWAYAASSGKPSMFVINQIDRPQADFNRLVGQIKERFGASATVVQFPAGDARSIIDVLLMKQLTFPADQKGKAVVSDIPADFQEEAENLHNALVEDIAVNDEALMELYFDKGELNEDEMRQGLHAAMLNRELFPIFCASGAENVGVSRLMSFIDNVCPSPAEMPPAATSEGDPVRAAPGGPPVMFIYRTMAEQHVGDYSFFRVYGGTIEAGMDLENAQTGSGERLGQLYALNGRERDTIAKMVAGDIGALVKLRNTHTNNTLRKKGVKAVIEPIVFPAPRYRMAIRAAHEGEEEKMAQGLHQIIEEDPSLQVVHDPHLSQITLGGQGELHLRIAQYRIKNKANVEIEFGRPRVAYRETVQSRARASYRHKKQTGGAGQFAHVIGRLVPLPADAENDYEFENKVTGGRIPTEYISSCDKGFQTARMKGPQAGHEIIRVKMILEDGSSHPVDSSEMAFKLAGAQALKQCMESAHPVLLEPIQEVEIWTPDENLGDVMGDLSARRGQILGSEPDGRLTKVKAMVPEADMYKYSTQLHSITHGRGTFVASFSKYQEVPSDVAQKVIDESKNDDDSDS
ncbi:MAG: elongation factor G [Bacteroidetes bacterium]|nr:elongation factor G [Bacteroidota bacterium]